MEHQRLARLLDKADDLYANGPDLNVALGRIEEYHRARPDDARAWVLKGKILRGLGRIRESWECQAKAISLDPENGDAYLERARILFLRGKHNRAALREARKAFRLSKRDSWRRFESLRMQCHILMGLGKFREAVDSGLAALKLKPKDLEIHVDLGEGFLYLKKSYEAVRHLDRFLRASRAAKFFDGADVGLAVEFKAKALMAMGRPAESKRLLTKWVSRINETVPRERLQMLLRSPRLRTRSSRRYSRAPCP